MLRKIALVGFLASCLGLAIVACKSGGVTPTEIQQIDRAPVAATPTAEATPPAQPVDGQTGTPSAINFYPNATFEAFNNSNDPKNCTADITSFDDQTTSLAHAEQLVAPGKSWNYSFNARCKRSTTSRFPSSTK